ncbi:hypothetical protein KP509_11G015200 [Ceratopteris richardii]|nr:hypothetical protein KP509_11G015200 [Ceratopteris richardii]
MMQSGVNPDGYTFVAAMKACDSAQYLPSARSIHKRVVENSTKPDIVVFNALIDMYIKCDSLKEAREVFDSLRTRDVVTWNTMIAGYSQQGNNQEAFKLLSRMQKHNMDPNGVTFASILKACSGTASMSENRLLHAYIVESALDSDDFLGSSLTDVYAKGGGLEDARKVFDCITTRSVVTWTTIIAGYAQVEDGEEAIQLFKKMCKEGIEPNKLTFASLVRACAAMADSTSVMLVHSEIIRAGFDLDVVLGSALVDVYAKHGKIEDAENVFNGLQERNIVTWSSMIGGYAHSSGHGLKALQIFQQMLAGDIAADVSIYVGLLRACSGLEAITYGRLVHGSLLEKGLECHKFVVSSLIDMYAKCKSIEDAYTVFQMATCHDVVTFSAMIFGYALQGFDKDAIHLFYEMVKLAQVPDTVTFVSVLKSCSNSASMMDGKLIYSYIVESQLEKDIHVGNSIVNMLTTCSGMEDAKCAFNQLQERDNVSWTTMITGYAQAKDYSLALRYYQDMKEEGWNPDSVSLVSILSACNQETLVAEGCEHFEAMKMCNIMPLEDHFNCMVDLLGNAGLLEEATDLLLCMPNGFDVIGWTSVLSHCSSLQNVEIGRNCFEHVMALDSYKAGAYVLVCDLFQSTGMDKDAILTEKLRQSSYALEKSGDAAVKGCDELQHLCAIGRETFHSKDMNCKHHAVPNIKSVQNMVAR